MICNGIDTHRLAAFGELVVTHPDAATMTATVETRWAASYRADASTSAFRIAGEPIPRATTLPADLPQALGGDDGGATPGELLLAALSACVTQAFVEGAAMAGVHLDHLVISADGQLDLRGVVGVEGVRPGFSRIHLDVEVAASADAAQVDGLLAAALRRSPVADTVGAGVAIDASVRQPHPA